MMVFNNKGFDSKQRFSIRKLTVGVCSVLLSTLFLTMNNGQTVHAETGNSDAKTEVQQTDTNAGNSSDEASKSADNKTVAKSGNNAPEVSEPVADNSEAESNKPDGASKGGTTSNDASANPVSVSSNDSNSPASSSSSDDQNKLAARPKGTLAALATDGSKEKSPLSDKKDESEEAASATIVYREGSQQISSSTITGTVGETTNITLDIPSGYQLVSYVTVPTTYTFTSSQDQYIYIPVVAPDHTVVHAGETKSIDFTFNYEKVKVIYDQNGLPTGVEEDGRLGTNNDSIKFTYTYSGDVLDASGNVISGGNWDFTSVENHLAEDSHGNDTSNMSSFSGTDLLNSQGGGVLAFGPVGSNSYYGWTIGPNISKSELSHYYLLGRLNPYSFTSPLNNLSVTFYSGYQLQFTGASFDYQFGHDLPDTISCTIKYLENPSVIAINTNGEVIKTLSPIQLTGDEGEEVMVDDGGTSGIANASADISSWAGYSRYTGRDTDSIIQRFGENNNITNVVGANFYSNTSNIAHYSGYSFSGNGFTLPGDDTTLLGPVYVVMVPDDQTNVYRFVDTDDNDQQVGSDVTISGTTDQTIDLSINIPEGYELADGQTLPTSYTFKATNQPIVIRLQHKRQNPVVPDTPDIPTNPDQPSEEDIVEDLIFVDGTGNVIARLPKLIFGKKGSEWTVAQVSALIKKFLPKGWVLPTNFTAKPIQINGRSAFVTLMLPGEDWNNETAATSPREHLGTVVYFMNADQQVVTNATAYWPKKGASAEQVLSFAKSHLPAGYELASDWHAQATQDRPTAIVVKVSKKSNTVATQTSADHVEKQSAFAPLCLLIAGLGMLGLGTDRRRKRH